MTDKEGNCFNKTFSVLFFLIHRNVLFVLVSDKVWDLTVIVFPSTVLAQFLSFQTTAGTAAEAGSTLVCSCPAAATPSNHSILFVLYLFAFARPITKCVLRD